MTRPLAFAVPGPLARRTGGSIYDRRIVLGLRARGRAVDVLELEGAFPLPSAEERARAAAVLAEVPDRTTAVVDGLVYGALPEAALQHGPRLDLVALVHHPLADETGLAPERREALERSERRALAEARRVIVTSPFTRRRLADFGVPAHRVRVVRPGTDPAPLATGGTGPTVLLCAASFVPRKGHADLLHALAGLRELDWRLVCAGKEDLDPETASRVRGLVVELGLAERVQLMGEVDEARLARLYASADVFVLASRYEGYGMVVSEALARGLPVVTTTGGALAETLPDGAGLAVEPGDVAGLRACLACVLGEPDTRERLARVARAARATLPTWDDAALEFAAALDEPGGPR